MQDIIKTYLTQYYVIDKNDVGEDGIYLRVDFRKFRAPIDGDKLIKELVTIFHLNEDTIKFVVNQWATDQDPNINLELYWKNKNKIVGLSGILSSLGKALGLTNNKK